MRKIKTSSYLRRVRRQAVWNMIKKKFTPVKELSIDEIANYPTEQKFTIFSQEDEDERHERHMG